MLYVCMYSRMCIKCVLCMYTCVRVFVCLFCSLGEQIPEALAAKGISHVIMANGLGDAVSDLSDSASNLFVTTFYESLFRGCTVLQARCSLWAYTRTHTHTHTHTYTHTYTHTHSHTHTLTHAHTHAPLEGCYEYIFSVFCFLFQAFHTASALQRQRFARGGVVYDLLPNGAEADHSECLFPLQISNALPPPGRVEDRTTSLCPTYVSQCACVFL